MAKELKKISILLILSWIFSLLFMLSGLTSLSKSIFGGILVFLGGLIIFPPFDKFLVEKKKIKLTGWLKFFVFVGLIVVGMSIVNPLGDIEQSNFDSATSEPQNFNDLPVAKSNSQNQQINYKFGERIVHGDWAYTFNNMETKSEIGENVLGSFIGEKADGIFLVFDVTIENIGKKTDYYLSDLIQIIDNQDRVFDHDSTAEIYLKDGESFGFDQIQPGLPKRGKIVFDVPKDIKGNLRISKGIFSSKYVFVSWN